MRRVPLSRFTRELNKWIRSKERIILTCNGKDKLVWIPIIEADDNESST